VNLSGIANRKFAKKVALSFGRAALGAATLLVIDHYAEITSAIRDRDLVSLQSLGFVILVGAAAAGWRAAQALFTNLEPTA
jgi:hypothetical protein